MNTVHIDNFDAVAFDMDGTLANTISIHHTTRIQAFEQHGFGHITPEQHALGPTYGSTSDVILGGILHAAGEIDDSIPFSENEVVTGVIATKLLLYQAAALRGFDPMPGAIKFVDLVAPRAAGNLALVTASEEEFITPFLTRSGIHHHFPERLIIGHETIVMNGLRAKPSPDSYVLAARRMNARNMLVFEDTVSGATAAKRVEEATNGEVTSTVIALAFDEPNAEKFRRGGLAYPPDAIVDSYDEAASLLGLTM